MVFKFGGKSTRKHIFIHIYPKRTLERILVFRCIHSFRYFSESRISKSENYNVRKKIDTNDFGLLY